MKKVYESPKAQKMVFNYSEVVVASTGGKCSNQTWSGDTEDYGEYCNIVIHEHEWIGDHTKP